MLTPQWLDRQPRAEELQGGGVRLSDDARRAYVDLAHPDEQVRQSLCIVGIERISAVAHKPGHELSIRPGAAVGRLIILA